MAIKCGNHSGTPVYHDTIAEARECYFGETSAAPVAKANGECLSDVPAATRKGVLDKLAKSAGITDAERAEARRQWASDDATETTPVPAPVRQGDATKKQVGYIRSLLASKVAPTDDYRAWAGAISDNLGNGDTVAEEDLRYQPTTLSKRDASHAISRMKDWAYAPKSYTVDGSGQGVTDPRGTIADEDGIYRDPKTGRIFKVQYNRASGDGRALYAKRLLVDGSDVITLDGAPDAGREVDMTWIYAGGLAKAGVEKAWRMNREDAAKFGRLYGVCVRCHRDLTDEVSIDRAMGPVCAGKMGW